MKLPKAKTENIIEQNLTNETLIYDLITHKVFNLNETSTIVYQACNGITTFEELKHKYQFTDDFIYLALDELKRNNLLAEDYQPTISTTNRRALIKKVGLASMVALPVITGLVTPTAGQAASGCPDPFSTSGIPSGCPTGGGVSDPQSCEAQSDASRSSTCNLFTSLRNRCASGTATYAAGSCTTTGPNDSHYSCVCV